MALAIDASTPVIVNTAGAVASLTTASFTPPLGALLVVMFNNAANTNLQTTPTNTGGAVTWAGSAQQTEAANACAASVWLGTVTTSASMTVTAHVTSSADWGFAVAVVTGQAATQNGATQIGTSASGAPSATIASLTGSNSLVLGSIANFSNGTGPTVGSNQSDSFNAHTFLWQDGTNAAGWMQFDTRISLSAGASDTINDSAPTIAYSMVAVEILVAGAAPASIPDLIMAPPHR